ncbi:MAG: hypothetical protein WCP35_02590 [Verrucomicrobiota bacterium]
MYKYFKRKILTIVIALLFPAGAATAEMHLFTDVKGRSVSAEITSAEASSIQVKLKSATTAKIEIAQLSEPDQAYVKEWLARQEQEAKDKSAAAAAALRMAEIPGKMAKYCTEHLGQQVGNGECWTLADEAFKACGLQRPGDDMRVWGRLLDLKKEKMQAGDIVEYRSAKFSNGSFTGPEHTSVVVKGGKRKVTIAEQNWSGHKTVREAEFDSGLLIAGEVMVYRPTVEVRLARDH